MAVSRRTALSAAASIAAAGGVHAETEPAAGDGSPTINLGVVGLGGRGSGAVADSLTANDNARLVAVAELDGDRAAGTLRDYRQRFGDRIDVADDQVHVGLDAYRRVLDDDRVDVVLLCTPPGFRPLHLRDAVAAGKHVFAEKPVCVDPVGYRSCLETADAADAAGLSIVTGTQYRRQTNFVEAIGKIHNGAIGDVVSATSRYCTRGMWFKPRRDGMSDAEYQLFNWMHFIWLSGDQITEQAVHNIDVMNWLMDDRPVEAFGVGGRFTRPEGSEMWDSMAIDYRYPGDRFISFKCRHIPNSTTDNDTIVQGTDGAALLRSFSSGSRLYDRSGEEIWSAKGSIAEAYREEHRVLVAAATGGEPVNDLRQTADSSLTAVMGRLAAYTGQNVTWDFVANESKLETFPEGLTLDSSLPAAQHAVPGTTELV